MLPNRSSILALSILFTYFSANAQIFGGNPSSLKWSQINTDTARIIFPRGLDSSGERVANIIHELQKNHNASIGGTVRKINIVLQNQSTLSNGYVGLGPYRSEFYLFAPQNSFNLGALNWVDNLALHEYRHVQQYSNFNIGVSKAARILFGQEGQALANAASIPDWFFEGDAVFNETVLSEQGRGRVPNFFNGYQSLMQSNRNYSYMKLRNGSLKHFVPNHYELGYLLTGYGREKYGQEFWKKVSQDAARFKPLFYPWQGAVKKYAGITYKQFVKDAFNYYQTQWRQNKSTSLKYITAAKTYPTDYKYPYLWESENSYIVLKRGYRQIPTFIKVTASGKQEKIATRGIGYDDYFSYNNGKIVYSSLNPDSRWGYREYGDIRLIDVKTREEKTITRGERYFAPDISHDGNSMVAVEMKSDQSSSLVIVDIRGKKSFNHTSSSHIYTYPKFSTDDKYIYTAVRNAEGQMALQKVTIGSKQEVQNIIPFGNRIIGFPTIQSDTILFSSSYKGRDEIWAYVESNNSIYRVATNTTGLYQGVFNNNSELITSHFTANGYRLATIAPAELLWQQVSPIEDALPDLYLPNALNQESNETLQNIPDKNYSIKKYKKGYNIFNFHSWRPLYEQPEFSFTIYGQNILNTFQTQLYYVYNENEKSSKVGFNSVYGGWYVQPFIGVSQTFNRNISNRSDTTSNELNGNVGLSLPLNLSAGKQFRYLTMSSSLNTQVVNYNTSGKKFFDQNFNSFQARLSYVGQIQKAAQHIYPRWAQTLLLQYRTIVNNYTAEQFLANGSLYLPGLQVNHNIVLTASYQSRDTARQYAFSNNFPFSRGYSSFNLPRLWKLGANYHFPFLYADVGFANIVYFKRLRANAFYDYTRGKSLRTGITYPFNTVGGELYFDTKWWNQQDVSFGIRYSRLLNRDLIGSTNVNQWQIILPVNLF